MKHIYNRKHQSLNLKIDDHVLLRLHKKYFFLSTKILDRKLSQQYIESFRILKKIEDLSYRLNLFQHWKIHLYHVCYSSGKQSDEKYDDV
jgi:hypothetical protein